MSLDASQWAWKVQGISATQKLILLSLADRANEQHECWPSMVRLQRDTCISNKQTIRNAIIAMEEMGILVTMRTDGQSNRYRLLGVENRDGTPTNFGGGTKFGRGTKNAPPTRTNIGLGGGPNLHPESYNNLEENLEENIYCGKSVCAPVSGELVVDAVVDPVGAVAEQVVRSGSGVAWEDVDKRIVDFVESFASYVSTMHPKLAPKASPKLLAQSAETVDKLMRLDGFSLEVIQSAMRFAVSNSFWAKNALSLCGLRKKGADGRTKFQKILAAMEQSMERVASACSMQGPRAVTMAQQRAVERDAMAKMLLEEEAYGQVFDVEAFDKAQSALSASTTNA